MAKNKTLQAVVSVAGVMDPSLSKTLGNVSKQIEGINFKAMAVGAAVGGALIAATNAVVDFGIEASKSAAEYEKQLANVSTLLDGNVTARIGELKSEVLQVSNDTGVATADLTDGLYQVISAFGDTEDSTKTLEIAAMAAKAGNATTTESINLLSAVTKGYGDVSAEAQQKAADLAFETVKLGQTSFPELASSMGKVIPLAQTMGVAQEELFGATATLTGVTGNTAEVMTQLRGTMQGFLQPTSAMTKAIESLGYADGKALLESEGLQGSLELLKESVGDNELAFAGLFGSVEAKNAVLALAGAQAENMTEKTQAMYEAAGAADRAFAAQTDNLEDTIAMLRNLGQNFVTEIGMEILPIVKEMAVEAIPFVKDFLLGMGDTLKSVTPMLGNFAATLLPMLSKLMSSLLPPILKLIEALLPPLMQVIEAALPPFVAILTTILPLLSEIAATILPVMGKMITELLEVITPLLQLTSQIVESVVMPLLPPLMQIVQALLPALMPMLTPLVKILEPISGILGEIVGWIAKVVGWVADGLGWVVDLFTGKADTPEGFATGGFTNGLSFAGEDPRYPTEAIISFNPAYRSQNLSYWAKAEQMLGASNQSDYELTSGGSNTSVVYDLSGLSFSPQIKISGDTDEDALIRKLRELEPEFVDFVLEALTRREGGTYVTADSRLY